MIASESKVTEAFVGSWNVLVATLPNGQFAYMRKTTPEAPRERMTIHGPCIGP